MNAIMGSIFSLDKAFILLSRMFENTWITCFV